MPINLHTEHDTECGRLNMAKKVKIVTEWLNTVYQWYAQDQPANRIHRRSFENYLTDLVSSLVIYADASWRSTGATKKWRRLRELITTQQQLTDSQYECESEKFTSNLADIIELLVPNFQWETLLQVSAEWRRKRGKVIVRIPLGHWVEFDD
jgi:hypothetical protein